MIPTHNDPTILLQKEDFLESLSSSENTTDTSLYQSLLGGVQSEELEELITASYVNGGIFITVITLFCIARNMDSLNWLYAPRLNQQRIGADIRLPPPIPRGYFSWLHHIISINERTIYKSAGTDTVMFLRLLKYMCALFAVYAVFGIGILVPIYMKGHHLGQLDEFTIANLSKNSGYYWFPTVLAYVFTGLALYTLYKLYDGYVRLRHDFLHDEQLEGKRMSIIIHNLPPDMRTQEALSRYFRALFPSTFRSAYVAKRTAELEKLVEKRDDALRLLERALVERSATGKRPTIASLSSSSFCGVGQPEDAILHFQSELSDYNEKIRYVVQNQDRLEKVDTGFVTFGSVLSATLAANVPINANPFELKAQHAPEPTDIYWKSVFYSSTERYIRGILVAVAIFWLVVFWIIPVSFAISLTSIEELSEHFPWLESFFEYSTFVRSLIQGYLPTLLLVGFMNVLPTILRALIKQQGTEAHSWMQKSLLTKYFIFMIFNFFFVVALSKSFFEIVTEIFENPSKLIELLGGSVPTLSTLYINYIMLRSFSGLPLSLFRIGAIFVCGFRKCRAKTERERIASEDWGELDYGAELPPMLLVMLLGFCYSTISPLVLPFACAFFGIAYIVFKYQVLYVYVKKIELGGTYFPQVFWKIVWCLIIAQCVLIGFYSTQSIHFQLSLLILLPILTFYIAVKLDTGFMTKSLYSPVTEALNTDHRVMAEKQMLMSDMEQSDDDNDAHGDAKDNGNGGGDGSSGSGDQASADFGDDCERNSQLRRRKEKTVSSADQGGFSNSHNTHSMDYESLARGRSEESPYAHPLLLPYVPRYAFDDVQEALPIDNDWYDQYAHEYFPQVGIDAGASSNNNFNRDRSGTDMDDSNRHSDDDEAIKRERKERKLDISDSEERGVNADTDDDQLRLL